MRWVRCARDRLCALRCAPPLFYLVSAFDATCGRRTWHSPPRAVLPAFGGLGSAGLRVLSMLRVAVCAPFSLDGLARVCSAVAGVVLTLLVGGACARTVGARRELGLLGLGVHCTLLRCVIAERRLRCALGGTRRSLSSPVRRSMLALAIARRGSLAAVGSLATARCSMRCWVL